jgi:protein-disulfide isomerase
MSRIISSFGKIWHQWCSKTLLWVVGIVLLFMVWLGWSVSAQAATNSKYADSGNPVSTELEAEVLQIIRSHPEVVWESLEAYQQQQQEQQERVRQSLMQELKASPQKVIGESPTTGAVEQKIVLLEFSDFQCPYCAEAYKTLKQFMTTHQDEVTLVYKHFPLNQIHPSAIPAAKAAWSAGQQGKFWQYHDALFDQQDELGEQLYLDIARNLNLDLEKFNRDRFAKTADTAIQKDIEMAQTLGIQGTPFFIMNGKAFAGAIPLSVLEDAL